MSSKVLAGNPLGDPVDRDVLVYVPPGYDDRQRYAAILGLVGFGGTGAMLFNADPLGEPLDARLDRLFAAGQCAPVIVATADCFTRVGGNQYINSPGTGRYADFLVGEVIPFVDAHYRTIPRAWGVFGRSSGGYGAITLGMHHPDTFCAVADHSGDACFELCYLPDFPAALDAYRAAGGPDAWLAAFWRHPNRRARELAKPLNMLAMCAHYSPGAWPFDLDTGAFRPSVWERWRAHDPVNQIRDHAVSRLAIYIDCGTRDEFALHWGARALVAELRAHGATVRHEEFDDGHFNLNSRYDVSLPFLAEAIGTNR